MSEESRKRVHRLSLEEKLWIINHKADNETLSHGKIAVDFAVKFHRRITRQGVSGVLKKQNEIVQSFLVDPELELKRPRYVKTLPKAKFEADLLLMVEEKYKTITFTHDIFRSCVQGRGQVFS